FHRWNLNPVRLPIPPRPPLTLPERLFRPVRDRNLAQMLWPTETPAVAGSACARQVAQRRGSGDPSFAPIGLVIGFDLTEPVEIVDHDPGGLLQTLGGDVAEPVEPLDARSVAEMKMRDRVERPAGSSR